MSAGGFQAECPDPIRIMHATDHPRRNTVAYRPASPATDHTHTLIHSITYCQMLVSGHCRARMSRLLYATAEKRSSPYSTPRL